MPADRTPITEAVRLVSLVSRGELDRWLDSITLVALRRRNGIRRRNIRLSKEPHMDLEQKMRIEAAWAASGSITATRLTGALGRSIDDMTTDELEELGWSVTVLAGVLDAELARRTGATDMAALPDTLKEIHS